MFSEGGTILLPAVNSMFELKNHHFGKVFRSIHLVFNAVDRNDWAPILGWKKESTKCAQVLEAFTIFIVFPLTPPFIDDRPIKTTIHRGCSYTKTFIYIEDCPSIDPWTPELEAISQFSSRGCPGRDVFVRVSKCWCASPAGDFAC